MTTPPALSRPLGLIDVGSNSVLLLVAVPDDGDRGIRVLAQAARITRLGETLARRGAVSAAALDRTLAACNELAAAARAAGAVSLLAVGTEAARVASNADDLREAMRAAGFAFRVLTAREEAEFAYRGVRHGLALAGTVLAVDVGGGSTEAVLARGDSVLDMTSLPVGCLGSSGRPAAAAGPVAADVRVDGDGPAAQAFAAVRSLLRGRAVDAMAATGGTITTLAAIDRGIVPYDSARVHGTVLTRGCLTAWRRRLDGMTPADRAAVPGMMPGRETTISAGLALFENVIRAARLDRMYVSVEALRHGLALALFDGILDPWH